MKIKHTTTSIAFEDLPQQKFSKIFSTEKSLKNSYSFSLPILLSVLLI